MNQNDQTMLAKLAEKIHRAWPRNPSDPFWELAGAVAPEEP